LMGFQAVSAVSSLVGGMQSQSESNVQSELALQQASARGVEAERAAQREAKFVQEDALATERKQKLAYLASGVTLEGSPLLIMEETRRKGQENVDEILLSGKAEKNAALLEGRVTASQAKSAGRQAFTSGLIGAAQSGAGLLQSYKDR
jgi:hypothetical protein